MKKYIITTTNTDQETAKISVFEGTREGLENHVLLLMKEDIETTIQAREEKVDCYDLLFEDVADPIIHSSELAYVQFGRSQTTYAAVELDACPVTLQSEEVMKGMEGTDKCPYLDEIIEAAETAEMEEYLPADDSDEAPYSEDESFWLREAENRPA